VNFSNMVMMTEVSLIVMLLIMPSVVLLYSIRYDRIMPLGVSGGSQVTMIDVELILYAFTFNGSLGAVE